MTLGLSAVVAIRYGSVGDRKGFDFEGDLSELSTDLLCEVQQEVRRPVLAE